MRMTKRQRQKCKPLQSTKHFKAQCDAQARRGTKRYSAKTD